MIGKRALTAEDRGSCRAPGAVPGYRTGVGIAGEPRTLVVAQPGSHCGPHAFSSINAALAVAAPHSTVIVCRGPTTRTPWSPGR